MVPFSPFGASHMSCSLNSFIINGDTRSLSRAHMGPHNPAVFGLELACSAFDSFPKKGDPTTDPKTL